MLRSLLSAYPAAKVVFDKPPIRRQTGELIFCICSKVKNEKKFLSINADSGHVPETRKPRT